MHLLSMRLLLRLHVFLAISASSDGFSRYGADMIHDSLMRYQIKVQKQTFVWNETASGNTCLPAIDASFSDVTGDTRTGSFITKNECAWFNNLSSAAFDVVQTNSDCVPVGTVFVTITNAYSWHLVLFNIQNVKGRRCFMNRFLIVTLDDETFVACGNATSVVHCLRYDHALGPSDFKKSDYMAITWIKSKIALSLNRIGLMAFIFDADVLFFKVPDVRAVIASNPVARVFHQSELMDYPALYRSISSLSSARVDENNYSGVSASKLNSGQMLWLPSNVSYESIPLALRYGVDGRFLDQDHIERALNEVSPESVQPLSYMYVSHCTGHKSVSKHSKNWITYHANCIKGMKNKFEALRFAQDSWKNLQREKTRDPYATLPSGILITLICALFLKNCVMTLRRCVFARTTRHFS